MPCICRMYWCRTAVEIPMQPTRKVDKSDHGQFREGGQPIFKSNRWRPPRKTVRRPTLPPPHRCGGLARAALDRSLARVCRAATTDLSTSLTDAELDMTVEEYLRAQCERRVEQLKRHMEGLIESFDGEAKKARKVLREIGASASTADEVGASATSADSAADAKAGAASDAFALVAITGLFAGKVFKFQPNPVQNTWSVGRADDNDVSLAGDDEVSSKHAQISFAGKQFKLMDLGSTNGTFASNGLVPAAKLKKKKNHVLKVDHLVTFGSCTFKWCYHTDAQTLADSLAKQQPK